nr:MAG TPA: hypothetical protein [Caudoviricetes sp.]
MDFYHSYYSVQNYLKLILMAILFRLLILYY